jgi:hypothetical protein
MAVIPYSRDDFILLTEAVFLEPKEKITGRAVKSDRAPPRRGAIAWKGDRKVLNRPM